jgi:hypothetical protein
MFNEINILTINIVMLFNSFHSIFKINKRYIILINNKFNYFINKK